MIGQIKQRIRIGDLGRVVTGRTPPTKQPELYGSSYPFITPTDIGDDSRYIEPARFISEEGKDKHSSAMLPPNAVCFTCIASIGKICMTNQLSLTNQQINSVVVDQAKYNPQYVFYLLRTETERIKSIASGVATPIINKSAFSEIEVEVPHLPAQQKIAAILSAYDNLIENNLRRIKILEEMAQNLYREWFVKFRFPGHRHAHFTDSPLGRIPQGWEVIALDSLIAEHIGGGWGNDVEDDKHTEPAWVIRGTDIPDARSCCFLKVPFRFHTKSNLKSRCLMPGDIVFEVSGGSKDQLLGRSLYISSEFLAAFNGVPVICASFCKRIQPDSDKFASLLLYLSFLDAYVSGEIKQYQVQSTGISNYKWSDYLEKVSRCVPPIALQERFCELSVPMFSEIATLGRNNTILRRTRDLLLPRLISGEVDVSALDIAAPEEATA